MPKELICIVTHTLPPEYGGADIAAYRYFKFLTSSGRPAIIVGYGANRQYAQGAIGIRQHISGKAGGYAGILLNYLFQNWLTINLFFVLLKYRSQISLVHSFNSASEVNVETVRVARWFGVPVISEISLMGSDDPCTLIKNSRRNLRSILKRTYRKYLLTRQVNMFVAKSAYIYEKVKACIPFGKVCTVPYFVDQEKFYPADHTERNRLRNDYNVPAESFCIVYCGGVNPRKGVDLLVDAFLLLKNKYKNLFLLLVGPVHKYDAKFVNSIFAKLEQNAVGSYLATREVTDRVDEYLKLADLFALPSYREGFPISVLEAMSTRLPVVCSDIPEIKDVQVKHNINGILFRKGNVYSLVEAIENLLNNTEKREKIAGKAYLDAKEKYSLNAVYSHYKSIYQKIVES